MKLPRRLPYRMPRRHFSSLAVRSPQVASALLLTLTVAVLLIMLTVSLVFSAKINKQSTLSKLDGVALEMAFESSIDYLHVIMEDKGFHHQIEGDIHILGDPKDGGVQTKYRIEMVPQEQTTISYDQSYNNLHSSLPVEITIKMKDGSTFPRTIPPHKAYIVHNLSCNNHIRREATLVASKFISEKKAYPVYASGKIRLHDQVSISTEASLEDTSDFSTVVWSNSSEENSITWEGPKPESFDVHATLQVKKSVDPELKKLSKLRAELGLEVLSQSRAEAPLNIKDLPQKILDKASVPSPTIERYGQTTTLSGEPEYYHKGALTIEGDLVLEDTALYVDGDLTIKGSVTGTGSLIIDGDTQFEGTSATNALKNTQNKVALLSTGYVVIKGFDGSNFLQKNLDLNPNANPEHQVEIGLNQYSEVLQKTVNLHQALEGAQVAQKKLSGLIETAYLNKEKRSQLLKEGGLIDQQRRKLGGLEANYTSEHSLSEKGYLGVLDKALTDLYPSDETTPQAIYQKKTYQAIKENIQTNKILTIGDRSLVLDPNKKQELVAKTFEEGVLSQEGQFDACMELLQSGELTDEETSKLLGILLESVRLIDLRSPGRTHFQGLIYSQSGIRAEHEVSITGGLYVEAPETTVANAEPSIQPGEVYLEDGCNVVAVPSIFKSVLAEYGGPIETILYLPLPEIAIDFGPEP